MPKVSILVPTYNQENYLKEALDSLIGQTLKDIEILCINDGSTDKTPQILEEYSKKDNRIKVINKENSGYGATMNIGLKNAVGEYIGILEPDDFAKNTMFEDLYNLAKNNDLDMVKSDFYEYFSKKNQARHAGGIKKRFEKRVINAKMEPEIVKILPSIWSAIYKRSFLEENNINFRESKGASYQDTSFAFKAITSAKRLMLTKEAYIYYRKDNENSSVKSKDKVYYICDEWEEISRFLDQKQDIKEKVNQTKLIVQFNTYKWNAIRIEKQFRDEFIEKFQKTFKDYFDKGEIKAGFFKKINKKEFELLLCNKEKYRNLIDSEEIKKAQKEKRQKQFSIRISPSRISIVLFGKQILEIS